jgi:hypothetical protein
MTSLFQIQWPGIILKKPVDSINPMMISHRQLFQKVPERIAGWHNGYINHQEMYRTLFWGRFLAFLLNIYCGWNFVFWLEMS